MEYTIAELHKFSDEDHIREHDSPAHSTVIGLNYYSNELARRAETTKPGQSSNTRGGWRS
jgi:hypothetical protein